MADYKVGDIITFTTWNREGRKTATRRITEINSLGIGVRFFGWNPFYLSKKQKDKIRKATQAEKEKYLGAKKIN